MNVSADQIRERVLDVKLVVSHGLQRVEGFSPSGQAFVRTGTEFLLEDLKPAVHGEAPITSELKERTRAFLELSLSFYGPALMMANSQAPYQGAELFDAACRGEIDPYQHIDPGVLARSAEELSGQLEVEPRSDMPTAMDAKVPGAEEVAGDDLDVSMNPEVRTIPGEGEASVETWDGGWAIRGPASVYEINGKRATIEDNCPGVILGEHPARFYWADSSFIFGPADLYFAEGDYRYEEGCYRVVMARIDTGFVSSSWRITAWRLVETERYGSFEVELQLHALPGSAEPETRLIRDTNATTYSECALEVGQNTRAWLSWQSCKKLEIRNRDGTHVAMLIADGVPLIETDFVVSGAQSQPADDIPF